MWKAWIHRLDSLVIVRQPISEKKNSELKRASIGVTALHIVWFVLFYCNTVGLSTTKRIDMYRLIMIIKIIDYVVIEPKRLITYVNVANYRKRSMKIDKTGWERRFTGNCTRNWNLTILPNGTCTNQNTSWRMRRIKFFSILRYRLPNPGQKTRPSDN